jgi:SNF2 family DNA or RNA helicase
VQAQLERRGISNIVITGKQKRIERRDRRRRFQKGKAQVALLQIKCARYGLDFSRADTAIFYSNSYSLEDRRQCMDRIVHPTKDRNLLYIDLVTKDTVDEDVVKVLHEKGDQSDDFMQSVWKYWRQRKRRLKKC